MGGRNVFDQTPDPEPEHEDVMEVESPEEIAEEAADDFGMESPITSSIRELGFSTTAQHLLDNQRREALRRAAADHRDY